MDDEIEVGVEAMRSTEGSAALGTPDRLTEAGFWRMVQAHSAGLDAVLGSIEARCCGLISERLDQNESSTRIIQTPRGALLRL
jgi:hypothetical protein